MKEYKIEKRRDHDGNEYVGISDSTDILLAGINDQLGEHGMELRIGINDAPSAYDYYYSVVKDVSQQDAKDKNFESEISSHLSDIHWDSRQIVKLVEDYGIREANYGDTHQLVWEVTERINNLTKKINAIQDCNDYKLTGVR